MSFPISVWYGTETVTPPELRESLVRDFDRIRKVGFRFVRGWVNWRDAEPKQDEYHLGFVKSLFDAAKAHGLDIILQVYLEFAPDWLPKIFPDSLYVSETGSKIVPAGSPGVCLDHPKARAKAEEFLKRLAIEVKDNPNFYGWDLWSEPRVVQWVYHPSTPRRIYCYCENSIIRFRHWATMRYKDIYELNRAWHRSFNTFEEVEPPRFVVLHYARENLDWITFNIEKLREDLEWRTKTVKQVDQRHIITSHTHGRTSALSDPLFGNPDDWEMAKVVDTWGTSLYPKHAGRVAPDPVVDAFVLDVTRCASRASNKNFWIGELQGGQGVGGLKIADPIDPEDISVWMWQCIAHEAKGINIYHWYPMMWGYESAGYGLANPNGSITDRAKKAGETAQTILRHQQDLLGARSPSTEVALLYNIHSYKAVWVLQPLDFSNLPDGTNGIRLISDSLLGVYRVLFGQGFQPDFVSLEQIENGCLENYKVLMATACFTMTRSAAVEIKKFVESGGTLLSDSRFAWIKEDGYIDSEVPSYNLSSVIGGVENEAKTVDTTTIEVIKNTLPGLNLGEEIRGRVYQSGLDLLELESQEVGITKSSTPLRSLVVNHFGKGWSTYVGTNVGYTYESTRDSGLAKLIMGVLQLAGVKRNVEILASTTPQSLTELRLLTNDQELFLFAINHSNKQNELLVKINTQVNRDSMQDLISGEEIKIESNTIKLALKSKQVIWGRL